MCNQFIHSQLQQKNTILRYQFPEKVVYATVKTHRKFVSLKQTDMKNFIKQLSFDKDLVQVITKANPELLYAQLLNGKITLKEYIAASKRTAR